VTTPGTAAGMLTFAPDAIIRARAGRLVIHTTASPLPAFETDNPMLVGWLCQFARPLDPQAALAALDPAERKAVGEVVDYLRRSGALVAAGDTQPPADPALARRHLRALSRGVYEIGCDILAEGDALDGVLQSETGVGLERRLLALLSALDGLRGDVHRVRDARLRRELAPLQRKPGAPPFKLHIGCGPGLLDGWVNIDVAPAPLALNILRGLPFPDASAQFAFVSHALEHLFFPRDVMPFLADVRRVLRPSGTVRLIVPDVSLAIEAYGAPDRAFFDSRRETWSWWPTDPTRLEDFLAYSGAGSEPAFTFESHKYGYDFETLEKVLRMSGFTAIRRCAYMQSPQAELRVDDVSSVARARFGERYYSLFVEAQRPE
jgi:SAM-dependent methyltransferase